MDVSSAREKMIARRFGGTHQYRTGGKGTVRRKKKTLHKTATSDDKKLGSTLKKLGVTNIPAIEEVNLFTNDGKVIHFMNPKVQASIAANTYVISGPNDVKQLTDLLPGIMNQLGPDHLSHLQRVAGSMDTLATGEPSQHYPAAYDDDVPELIENFEDVSKL